MALAWEHDLMSVLSIDNFAFDLSEAVPLRLYLNYYKLLLMGVC